MRNKKRGVIVGLGEFGYHLAISLSEQKTEVIVIDNDEMKINKIKDDVSEAIIGDVRLETTLFAAIPKDIDFAVVAIGDIEASMLCTLFLKERGVIDVFVKAINDQHQRILKMLGIKNIIFPEKDIAERIAKQLSLTNFLDYLPISEEYSFAEIMPLNKMLGKNLIELDFRKKYRLSVIALREKKSNKMSFNLDATRLIHEDDIYFVIGLNEDVENYYKLALQDKKTFKIIRN